MSNDCIGGVSFVLELKTISLCKGSRLLATGITATVLSTGMSHTCKDCLSVCTLCWLGSCISGSIAAVAA